MIRVAGHNLDVVLAETSAVVGEPLHDLLALLGIRTTRLSFTSVVDGYGTGRGTEPCIVVAVLMVGKHQLGGEAMIALSFFGEQWQEIEFDGGIPIEKFRVGMVFLKFLSFHGIGAYNLSHEIIIACRILRIHHRCRGISLNGILEHTPVGIVAVYDTWSHIGSEGEEPALRGMHD